MDKRTIYHYDRPCKSPKNLNRRTAHWHADLQEYNFDILYILGKTNIPPDALLRLPGVDQGKEDNQQVTVLPEQKFKVATTTLEPKINVPPIDIVKQGIMNLMHNHPSAGHPGQDETLRKTQERYQWPGMKEWIASYIKGCAICQQNKIITYRTKTPPYRIPTETNARPFQRVAMDLIMGLPPVKGKDAILTIVDQGCSCAAIFLACDTTITGPGIAQLYMDHMFQWFGLPTKIISDRDPRFTSHFGKALTRRLDIQQNLSTAFHPQTDGLSERKNQWVEQYLRLVMSAAPKDWTQWLALATAVHNNQKNSTTRLLPNQIILGYDLKLNPAISTPSVNETTEERIRLMEERHAQATAALSQVAEKSGTPSAQYNTGDQVWLEGENLCLPYQTTKLAPKRYGPFKIIKEISPVAYQLALPLMWKIHNMFHASLLSPYRETTAYSPNFSRPPPDLINDEEQYEVEQIHNHQYFGRNKTLQYLIHWKGYPDSDDTWELAADTHAPDLVKAYHKGTPLESIKAGCLSIQDPILLHPGYRPRTTQLGRKSLDTSSYPALPNLLSLSTSSPPVYHPQVPYLPSWTMYPHHSRPCSQTSILLPRTPLHLSQLTANTTLSSTSATILSLPCLTTLPMHPLNPPEVVPTHPHPATPLVEWRTYSPATPISTLKPFITSQPVWSRPSRIAKKSIASLCSLSRTKSKGLSQPSKVTPRLTNKLQMGMSATPCTPTSRSHWVKECTPKPTGLPQLTMGTSKHTDRSKDPWIHPIRSPSMLAPSTHPSLSIPFPPGSTNSWSAPPPFTLTSPKQPTDLMTGASLRILRATANWTTTCPVLMQSSNGSKLKQGQLGSRRLFVKADWSWLAPPSNWCIWSAWRCRSFSKGTSSLPLGGDGRSPHAVALARVGGNVTGLR